MKKEVLELIRTGYFLMTEDEVHFLLEKYWKIYGYMNVYSKLFDDSYREGYVDGKLYYNVPQESVRTLMR